MSMIEALTPRRLKIPGAERPTAVSANEIGFGVGTSIDESNLLRNLATKRAGQPRSFQRPLQLVTLIVVPGERFRFFFFPFCLFLGKPLVQLLYQSLSCVRL